jgi:cytochrome P450
VVGGDGEAKKACARVRAIVDEYIEDAHKGYQRPSGVDGEAYDLVRELAQSTRSRVDLRNQILNVFMPGYDFTAIGLSDIFFQLARHLRVWGKLRKEIMAIDQPITLELVSSLRYFKRVLNESKQGSSESFLPYSDHSRFPTDFTYRS